MHHVPATLPLMGMMTGNLPSPGFSAEAYLSSRIFGPRQSSADISSASSDLIEVAEFGRRTPYNQPLLYLQVFGISRFRGSVILAGTGGANQVVQQPTSGGAITVGTLDAASIAAGTMATARLGSGTANATSYLRGDQTWASLDVIARGAPNSNFDLTNAGVGGNVDFFSKSITGIAVGDLILVDLWYTILNNSGAARTYTPTIALGGFTIINAGTIATVANSATGRAGEHVQIMLAVSATNLTYGQVSQVSSTVGTALTAGTVATLGTNASFQGYNTTASDMTGTNTFSYGYSSSSTTATQTLTLHGFTIHKGAAV